MTTEPRLILRKSESLLKNRNVEQVKTPPGHPSPNNVETVMKPLGKAMKIGQFQNQGEKGTLSSYLVNYRDTPHSATGASPAQIFFDIDTKVTYHTNHYLIRKEILLELGTRIKKLTERMFRIHAA